MCWEPVAQLAKASFTLHSLKNKFNFKNHLKIKGKARDMYFFSTFHLHKEIKSAVQRHCDEKGEKGIKNYKQSIRILIKSIKTEITKNIFRQKVLKQSIQEKHKI